MWGGRSKKKAASEACQAHLECRLMYGGAAVGASPGGVCPRSYQAADGSHVPHVGGAVEGSRASGIQGSIHRHAGNQAALDGSHIAGGGGDAQLLCGRRVRHAGLEEGGGILWAKCWANLVAGTGFQKAGRGEGGGGRAGGGRRAGSRLHLP